MGDQELVEVNFFVEWGNEFEQTTRLLGFFWLVGVNDTRCMSRRSLFVLFLLTMWSLSK